MYHVFNSAGKIKWLIIYLKDKNQKVNDIQHFSHYTTGILFTVDLYIL